MSEDNNGAVLPNENEQIDETIINEEVDFSEDEKSIWEDDTSKKVDSLFAQKKHWRDKHEKLAKEFEEYKGKQTETPKVEKEVKTSKKSDDSDLRAELQEIRLAQANPTLKSAQIKKAINYAKAEGVEPQDLINGDFFQVYVERENQKLAEDNATPNPSSRTGSGKINFDKIKDDADAIANLSGDDYEKFQKYLLESEGGAGSGIKVRSRIGM